MKQKYAIYLRKACAEQCNTKASLDDQEDALRKLRVSQGWKQAKIYREIGSGMSLVGRPIFRQLLWNVLKGDIHTIACTDITRLTRDVELWTFLQELIRKGQLEIKTPRQYYYCEANGKRTHLGV